jgi:CubicO group peptidase (beta-lactamase class C family)
MLELRRSETYQDFWENRMKNRQSMSFVVLTFLVSTLAAVWSPILLAQSTLQERVDRVAQSYVDNNIVMGMTIGVLHEGQTQAFGYGHMSKVDPRAPDGDTVYEIGSISKVFTGVLLADAVTQGRATLNQAAGDLLPSEANMPARGDRAISLRDLATHTSGLPRLPDNMKMTNPNNPYADYTVANLYEFLHGHKLNRAPGEKSEYSNLAQGLLGHLLAHQAGCTYEQLLHDRIVAPLEMTSTSITLNEQQTLRLAPPHTADGQPAANWDLPVFAGAGAIRSTATDMLRFALANLEPPAGELGAAIELAWTVHQQPLTSEDFAMGLGWHVARDGSTRWHNGQTGGYHSMFLVSRDIKSGVVLLANTATGEVDRLAEDIMRMIAGAEVEPRTFERTKEVSPDILQKYVGKYELAPGVIFTVSVQDEKLFVGLTGQPTFQVYARSDTEWFYKVVPATLTFELDDDGKCHSLELFQNGSRHKSKRFE